MVIEPATKSQPNNSEGWKEGRGEEKEREGEREKQREYTK